MRCMRIAAGIMLLMSCSTGYAADPCAVSHWQFQAVHADGSSSFDDAGPLRVKLTGIVLNKPGDMVDPTADYQGEPADDMGGQWQIYIQGEGDDHAGTAVWMGQNYSSLGFRPIEENYADEQWHGELARLNAPAFGPGDRVAVTGSYLFFKGKLNINEQHHVDSGYNFTIELLRRGVGLPRPEVITLDDVKDASDDFIFEPDRTSGCEYYQARLVRINNVSFVDPNQWGPNAEMLITDGEKTFPVKLGLGSGIYAGSNNLGQRFDIIAIFDQEPPAPPYPPDSTSGYRLWVMDYDGNGSVLAGREHRMAGRPGDVNLDGVVDFVDLAKLAEDWLK